MAEIHRLIANALILYYALLGVWGLFLAIRRAPFDGAYRGALIIGVVIGVVQAVVGIVLLLTGPPRLPSDLHYLYGASVIVTLPLVHQFIGRRGFSRTLAYGLASLFMVGLVLRAISTASG
jgi:heme A synthase